MQNFLLCIFTLFIACSGEHNDAHFAKEPSTQVREKLTVYCEKSRAEFLARKWAVDECDGLLFTSLRGIACGDIDIEAFESTVEPGQWYRNPKKDCYVADKVGEQGSDSTISKDMYVGLSAYLVHTKDSNALHRTIDFGERRSWVVGEAKDAATLASKCFITPSLQEMLKQSLRFLGAGIVEGPNSSDAVLPVSTGFRAHLDVLAILVRGKTLGHISQLDLNTLKDQAKRSPRNALFLAAKARYDDGDFALARAILLDPALFPEKELPTNANYCTTYLWQRDDDPSDWAPCGDAHTWDGTDYVFAAAITEGLF